MRKTRKFHETYYMPLWSREELYEAARVLDLQIRTPGVGSDLSDSAKRERDREAEIDARFEIFGGVARYCLHPDPIIVVHALSDLDGALDTVADLDTLQLLMAGKSPASVVHRLLHFRPEEYDRAAASTALASPHVKTKLAENMLAKYRNDREHLRRSLGQIPDAASLCGVIFEQETHEKFIDGCSLELRRLTLVEAEGGKNSSSVTVLPTTKPVVKFRAVVRSMLTRGPYHHPESKVWESIDAFYLPTITTPAPTAEDVVGWNLHPTNRLLLFQFTVSETHAVNVVGIVRVLAKLGLLESVAADPERAALVFVVPKGIVCAFKRQPIVVPTLLGSNLITTIDGIADKTAAALGKYTIRTVDELQAKITSFDLGTFTVQPEDTAAWMRARRSGIKHGLASDGTQYNDAIATIPQYVCTWASGGRL